MLQPYVTLSDPSLVSSVRVLALTAELTHQLLERDLSTLNSHDEDRDDVHEEETDSEDYFNYNEDEDRIDSNDRFLKQRSYASYTAAYRDLPTRLSKRVGGLESQTEELVRRVLLSRCTHMFIGVY